MKAISIIALLLFAGCLGIGPDEAGFRDVVTVTYSAVDDTTGDILTNQETHTFILVAGQSGLGSDFESAIVGMSINQTKAVSSPASQRGYDEEQRAERVFPDIPLVRDIDTASLNGYLGFEATVGTTFELPFYPAIVEAIENGTATYRLQPQDGQRDPVPDLGAELVTTIIGDTMVQTLDPVVGATFVIQPPSPFDPRTPLDLPVGSFKVRGAEGSDLVLGYNPSLNPDLLEKDITFTVTLTGVEKTSDGVEPMGGNYGARYSPYLMGEPGAVMVEGHDHDGHDHTH